MRKLCLLITLAFILPFIAQAQPATTVAASAMTYGEQWKYDFSQEGIRNWRPEATLRHINAFGGLYGFEVSLGARIDDKRTFGVAVGAPEIYYSGSQTTADAVTAGLYFRRYFHVGSRDIVAFYGDLTLGALRFTHVHSAMPDAKSSAQPGQFKPWVCFEPGVRIRLWHNLQIFAGPSLSPECLGLHVGIGL